MGFNITVTVICITLYRKLGREWKEEGNRGGKSREGLNEGNKGFSW